MKHKKHDKITQDYKNQKAKELTRLASKLLRDDEKNQKLKSYNIKNPLDYFEDEKTKE